MCCLGSFVFVASEPCLLLVCILCVFCVYVVSSSVFNVRIFFCVVPCVSSVSCLLPLRLVCQLFCNVSYGWCLLGHVFWFVTSACAYCGMFRVLYRVSCLLCRLFCDINPCGDYSVSYILFLFIACPVPYCLVRKLCLCIHIFSFVSRVSACSAYALCDVFRTTVSTLRANTSSNVDPF